MTVDEQIRNLIENAPQDGTTPALVEAIAPVLRHFATQLRHLQYYVVQSLDGSWAVNILEHRTETGTEKRVVYAFSALKDAASGQSLKDPQIITLPVPVTHILFQLTAMDGVDGVIFFETPGNTVAGTEIRRADLQAFIQVELQKQVIPLPPDIA